MNGIIRVLIPAFNAAMTLPALLQKVKETAGINGIIVIDDGSTDGTSEAAARGGASVRRHERNMGKGAALRTGFLAVLEDRNVSAVITMDADQQHDAIDLPKFLMKRSLTGASIVVGVRQRFGSGMPVMRILSNTLTSLMVSARTGVPIADSQCGYRLIGREVLESIQIEADGYEAETEMLIRAAGKGFSIAGVPVRTRYQGENSHMTHWLTTKRFVQVLLKDY